MAKRKSRSRTTAKGKKPVILYGGLLLAVLLIIGGIWYVRKQKKTAEALPPARTADAAPTIAPPPQITEVATPTTTPELISVANPTLLATTTAMQTMNPINA